MKRLCTTALLLFWGFCALAIQKSGTIVVINGSKYYIHTVQPGETLYALSKEYLVGEKIIVEHNPSAAEGLKAGESVKIPFIVPGVPERMSEKKLRKTFSTHTVEKGDNLYGIARRFQVPIQSIIEDNPGLDPTHLKIDDRILIRKTEIGSETETENKAQWEQYRSSLNSVVEAGFSYHMVHPGETFYSLSRRFGIGEEELSALNGGLKPADLKAGAILKVPGGTEQNAGEQTDSLVQTSAEHIEVAKVLQFSTLKRGEPVNVALLLPMAIDGEANGNYLEFYQGFLLGLDSIKRQYGISADVNLYNTGRKPERIREIVESPEFRNTNLIIGPVYEEGLYPVVQFAEQHHIPVVSPLANLTQISSPMLFQLAPDPDRKYAKVADLLNSDKHITLIYSGSTDKEFEQEILGQLEHTKYSKHNYRYVHPSGGQVSSASDLSPLLDNGDDNVFVIMADNEVDVDRILAAIASADTNITARGRTTPRFVVLGNARWNRYNNLDRAIFFKDRVVVVSNYHAKRDSQTITGFDKAYIRAFGSLPTLYSYRGYDAAMLFCPAMYDEIEQNMEGGNYTPLQTTYIFGTDNGRSNHVNQNWMRVNYHADFTITIE